MIVIFKEREYELDFTFNSIKYMKGFDVRELQDLENKPFKVFDIAEILLLGAFNHKPNEKYNSVFIADFIMEYMEENSIADLLEELMNLLQESRFFKALQKMEQKPKSKKK